MGDFLTFVQSSSAGLSLASIVTLGIVSILLGGLVPVRSHNREIRLLERQNSDLSQERDDWKDAYKAKSEQTEILLKQNSELIEASKATKALIESMRAIASRDSEAK